MRTKARSLHQEQRARLTQQTWQVHLDVKPRNFCAAYLPAVPPHQATGLQQVYIIDLEGTRAVPEAGTTSQDDDFFGTVDYAGTTALLRKAVGPCDDLESLCYRCGARTLC